MNRKIIQFFKIVFIGLAVFGFFNIAYANTTVHLDIETDTGSIYNQNISVQPCDSENTGTMETTAYCALSQSGIASDWSGLWVNSINGIVNNANNNGVYWMWLVNLNTNNPYSDFTCHQDAPYGCSAKQYILNPNDNILFYYNINPPTPTTAPASGGGPLLTSADIPPIATLAPIIKPIFDTKKAFDFLIAQQKSDGSFGEDLYTDWVALALASGNYQDQVIKLVKYFGESKTTGTLLTDYERHAIALMALGLNPYNTNGENYIEKIIAGFDGKQFGNISEDNDDIFALIVLQNAGYAQNEKMINDDINFILSRQKENGSWDESVDMTGASIEALSAFSPVPGIGESLERAKEFLKQNQKDNGSWNNNASSTAWALEGILALNEKPEDWIPARHASQGDAGGKSENTPLDYFATRQDTDGGIRDDNSKNKIWETAYVASALSGKTWNQIMQKFEKPKIPVIMEAAPIPARNATQSVAGGKNIPIAKVSVIKKVKPKLENLASQNTATVINAIIPSPSTIKTEPVKKNWFARFLDRIFSIF